MIDYSDTQLTDEEMHQLLDERRQQEALEARKWNEIKRRRHAGSWKGGMVFG